MVQMQRIVAARLRLAGLADGRLKLARFGQDLHLMTAAPVADEQPAIWMHRDAFRFVEALRRNDRLRLFSRTRRRKPIHSFHTSAPNGSSFSSARASRQLG